MNVWWWSVLHATHLMREKEQTAKMLISRPLRGWRAKQQRKTKTIARTTEGNRQSPCIRYNSSNKPSRIKSLGGTIHCQGFTTQRKVSLQRSPSGARGVSQAFRHWLKIAHRGPAWEDEAGGSNERALSTFAGWLLWIRGQRGVGKVEGDERPGRGRRWEKQSRRNTVSSVGKTKVRIVIGMESRNTLEKTRTSEWGTCPAQYSMQCLDFNLLMILVVEIIRAIF